MSALCHEQTFCAAPKMGLIDHLVGGHKKARRHRKAEGLCCLEVERRLIPGRCLHWKVEWFGASQDAIDKRGRLLERASSSSVL